MVKHKLFQRLHRDDGLAIARGRGKLRVAVSRVPLPAPSAATERWSIVIVSDALAHGWPSRSQTRVDDLTRECPAIEVSHALPALRVIHVLEWKAPVRGLPRRIACNHRPQHTGQTLDHCAHERGVSLQFIRPGKPVENAFTERANGKLRDQCLGVHWFTTLRDAQQRIEAWRHE